MAVVLNREKKRREHEIKEMMRDIMSYTQDLMTRAGYPAFKSDRHIKGNTGRMRV